MSLGPWLSGSLSLFIAAPNVLASGFAIPENSIAGLGVANALVANPVETGAIVYNPAAMGFHEKSSISLGGMLFNTNLSVTTASGTHDSEGEDSIFIPAFQGTLKFNERISVGLGANAPFGLETKWAVGTFPQLSVPLGQIPPGLLHPTQSKLELISLAPTVAYKINDDFSVAAGVDYYNANKVNLNTGLVDINGDGDGWGWNISALYRMGPLSFGASYHSETTLDIDGGFQVTGSPKLDAKADLDLPSRLQIGARYAFSETLAAEFDWSRTGWSHFKDIIVTSAATGQVLSSSRNDWDDANAYRLGLTYNIRPQTQLRFGYTYDETGQNSDYFSARIPDADRQLFSIGIAQGFADGWQVEGGYMYVLFDDNDYRSNKMMSSSDPNGTSALNGNYEADVHIFGLGVNKTF
jgi:long-chain fatty acid transport protein